MLEFPYMDLPGGVSRPMIAVLVEGPAATRIVDGLLDTGSDRTILPQRLASVIGVSLDSTPHGSIQTAGAVRIAYRVADVTLELRTLTDSVRWTTPVAFAESPLNIVHLGFRSFIEFFHCTFMGPEKHIVLNPRPELPVAS